MIGAALLGVVATLGFAPISFWPASLLALAGLFHICRSTNWKRAAVVGWVFGFTHFATGIYWVFISTHIYGGAPFWLGLLLAAVLFAYMAIYPALLCGLLSAFDLWNRRTVWLLVPLLWLACELLRGWVMTGFPWLSLGYVAIDTWALNFAPILGVHGLSALFALSALAISRMPVKALHLGTRLSLCAIAGFPFVAGALLPQPSFWTANIEGPINVAIVQGNVPQDQKWLPGNSNEVMRRYRDMTLSSDAELIVWPEVVPNKPYHQITGYFADLNLRLQQKNAALLAGVLIHEDQHSLYNSMIALGTSQGRYDKRHLVPFGEYFPIPDWLRPIMDVLGTPYSDFSTGPDDQASIVFDGQKIGLSICFEDVFPAEFADQYGGSNFLVNTTNDAWFAGSSAPYQHLDIARFRAAENAKWLVRSTNTGISALIGPDGEISQRTANYSTELLEGNIVPRTGKTPYASWGDRPLWLASAGLSLWLAMLAYRKRKPPAN